MFWNLLLDLDNLMNPYIAIFGGKGEWRQFNTDSRDILQGSSLFKIEFNPFNDDLLLLEVITSDDVTKQHSVYNIQTV